MSAVADVIRQDAAPRWTSLHVFIHDFDRLDGFLCDCLAAQPAPFLADCFFVRYWLGGPHVRLRFRGDGTALEASARDWLARHAFASDLEPDSYYARFASELHTEPRRYWHGNGELHYIPYEPETARYGGIAGVGVCERFFVEDSNAVLALLHDHPAAQREKVLFGYCLVLYDVLAQAGLYEAYLEDCHGIGQADVAVALQARIGGALARAWPGLQAAGARYATGTLFPEPLVAYRDRLARVHAALGAAGVPAAALPAIFYSLLHMTFNRAGIHPLRENTVRLFALAVHVAGRET
ncbi:thiopeptide-type bacteriocin biosynthesis protein [[Empedobacter] haloabium]|uniref:Thiopeptide-type bacteriocin biosynthesis protein n=1 Tax=[Empedobacter] haloabium TaxID=592317 RepID=A0ABZ1UN17_9BURK